MKAATADAIRRLIADPAATDGEREAARARLAAAGEGEPPLPPPTAVAAPGDHPFDPIHWKVRWTWTGTNTATTTGTFWRVTGS